MENFKGPNYEITVDSGVATCRIWQRPDLSTAEGADCAQQMVAHFEQMAQSGSVRAVILDKRASPPVFGPRTEASLKKMISSLELARKPILVILGDNAIQRMQMQRLVQEAAPKCGQVHYTAEEAATAVMRDTQRLRKSRP